MQTKFYQMDSLITMRLARMKMKMKLLIDWIMNLNIRTSYFKPNTHTKKGMSKLNCTWLRLDFHRACSIEHFFVCHHEFDKIRLAIYHHPYLCEAKKKTNKKREENRRGKMELRWMQFSYIMMWLISKWTYFREILASEKLRGILCFCMKKLGTKERHTPFGMLRIRSGKKGVQCINGNILNIIQYNNVC